MTDLLESAKALPALKRLPSNIAVLYEIKLRIQYVDIKRLI